MVNEVCIVEALNKVVCRDVRDAYRGKTIAIYRTLTLDIKARYRIAGGMSEYVGRPYGWLKIVAHGLDKFFGGVYLFRRLAGMDKYPICSWPVAHVWAREGLYFGVKPGAADPDDIWDYVTTHPEQYECIKPLSKLGEHE
jgi:hypothetical protein